MDDDTYKARKLHLESRGSDAIQALVAFFMAHATPTKGIPPSELEYIKTIMAYNLSLMITDPENKEPVYVAFFESIVQYAENKAIDIDVETLEGFWNELLDVYRESYRLLTQQWELAIEMDEIVENTIRAIDVDDPKANASHVREKLELLQLDAALATAAEDALQTKALLETIVDVKHVDAFRTSLRDDGKGVNVSPAVVYGMMYDKTFPKGYDTLITIDARFPFEYQNGHVAGALNVWNYKRALSFFETTSINDYATTVFVFHCEFSSSRGPGLASCFADLARKLTHSVFGETDRERKYRWEDERDAALERGEEVTTWEDVPKINYFPQVYIMTGGYKLFFETYPTLCTPRFHLKEKMTCKAHQDAYCSSVQPRSNVKPGQKGKTVPTFMTPPEYDDWYAAWHSDRMSNGTMTDVEIPFLEPDVQSNDEEEKEEEKAEVKEEKIVDPPLGYDAKEEEEEEEKEEDDEYDTPYSKRRGKGRKKPARRGDDDEETKAFPSKRGRKGQ